MHRHPHILNAATNLLGICFIIIGGLKLANQNPKSYSDEVAWAAAAFLLVSIILSYAAIRNGIAKRWRTRVADWSFLAGLGALVVSVMIAAYQL
jgi:hypothetical protein